MSSKQKEIPTELQVFSLDNLNPALLPELSSFKEAQLLVVKENPFVAITDAASRDLAKKHRTARVSARTTLQNQDKLISSKFNDAKTKAKAYIAELIAYTKPGEDEQQAEIDRDELVLEEKRNEKARLEKERIENINKELESYFVDCKLAFNLMTFETIDKVGADFLESYTTYDTTILQEFESLFPSKVEELTKILMDKRVSLTEAENARLAKLKFEEEAKKLAEERAIFETKQKEAAEAELKAKAEKDKLEKEKAEFEAKQKAFDAENDRKAQEFIDAMAKLKADKKVSEEESIVLPETLKGIEVEEKSIELIQNVDSSVPENTTVNVCTDLPKDISPDLREGKIFTGDGLVPLISKEIFITPTWKTIQEEFKASGEKSYSVWLEKNYTVPSKIQS